MNKERIVGNSSVEKAIEEYDQYLSGDNQNGGLMVRATKERVDRRVREIEGNIIGKEQAYNNRKQEVDKLSDWSMKLTIREEEEKSGLMICKVYNKN